MALEITSLKELDTAQIDAMFATFTQLLQERHPDVELTRGVFHDLVVYLNATLNAAIRENIARVLASNSLQQINANPALADAALVDKVLSNFNLTRDTGARAVGEVTIVLNQPVQTTISSAVTFSADGIQFRPTLSFVALLPGTTATQDYEREMLAVGDGTYTVNILVQAVVVGTGGNIRRNTKLTCDTIINNSARAFAASDFVNGAAPLSNADYVSRLSGGLAAKVIGGRQNYIATIRNQAAFANIPHISVLGCGDPEQFRDQHGLFPISGGGKIDIYCQTNAGAQEREHILPAVYKGQAATGALWQVAIPRDLAPGLYEVVRVARPLDTTATGYSISRDDRTRDFDGLDFAPDLRGPESAYTRYQTAVIQFVDTDTSSSGLTVNSSTALYSVTTASLPLIAEIQDFLSDRDNRSRAADVVVKAAVPCFTKISFDIRKDANAAEADTAPIKTAIVAAVREVGFSGQLHASRISAAVQPFLSGRASVGAIDMFGRIRRPDGSVGYIRDSAVLQIPNDPGHMVTGRTTAFLVNEADISISFKAAGFAD